jgi:hypothetical protein
VSGDIRYDDIIGLFQGFLVAAIIGLVFLFAFSYLSGIVQRQFGPNIMFIIVAAAIGALVWRMVT